MAVTTSAHEPQWLVLCPGQAGLYWLPVGATFVTSEGSLRLEPSSRSVAATRYTLGVGHAHVVETSGWWRLRADERSGAHLHIVAGAVRTPRPMQSAMGHWLTNIIQPRQTSRG